MNTKANNPTDPTSDSDFVITRVFDAPRELVFEAWTDPKQVVRWWGPKGFTSPCCKIDLRVGGTYLYCMRAPDGQDYWNKGIFHEIVVPEKIVSTIYFSDKEGNIVDPSHYGMPSVCPPEMLDTVTFTVVDGNKTKLTIHRNVPMSISQQIMMDQGWSQSLERFAEAIGAKIISES